MKSPYEILRRPVLTEKSMAGQQRNVYSFVVAPEATKPDVKHAVEKAFNVKVDEVRTVTLKGKVKRQKNMVLDGKRKDVKKAYVTLKEGFRLDII
ncbi:MAG TPA: 50S ribosomal protein L23 [Planctomycetota bacterium]